MTDEPEIAPPGWLSTTIQTYLRVYHRHEVRVDAPVPDRPVLFVCNHGFGGVIDLNVGAFVAALAATVAALIFGSLVPTRVFSPVLRRAAELVEYAAIAAVIPLACWVCGLYAAMRGL